MKIVFLSFYSGVNSRGVETYVHELANQLVSLGHDVTVFQTGDVLPKSTYRTCIKSPSHFTIKVLDSLSKLNPDFIIPTNGRSQALLCRLWTFFRKTKLIISGQSGPGFDDRLNLYFYPDAFVSLTTFQKHWALHTNPFVKIVTIPNGVDLNLFNPRVKPISLDLPKPIILNVAALEPIKRQELLITAVSQTSASLLLVGSGSRYEYLNRLGHQLLPGRFKISSYPYQHMPSVYKSCDLFVYPTSPWESFGIAILEALAIGLPIIGTNDSIRREIIGSAGLLVNPESTDKFSRTITKALATNWKDLPVVQAKKFSWESIGQQYDSLFHALSDTHQTKTSQLH